MRAGYLLGLLLAVGTSQAAEPVATVRVGFDRAGVTGVRVQGMADIAAGRALSADDPVRIASISKLVAALGVMRMVEAGQLDLDTDVSEWLEWPVRHPQHPQTPITLRLLLSHRAGLTDAAGYYAVPVGGHLREVLEDPRAWDAAHAPGTFFRYANVNFPIIAAVMEKASGERFDRLMQRLVLQPLGIAACYNWESCDDATVARAVVLYDEAHQPVRDDNRGKRPACAVVAAADGNCDLSRWRAGENGALFAPQGGLRISANGLARIGRLLLGEGEVDGVRLLSAGSVRLLAQPLWTYAPGAGVTSEEDDSGQGGDGFFCRYGLAMQTLATPVAGCHDDPFGDGVARVGHSGSAYGLLSGLWIDPVSGTGVTYFATGLPEARQGTHSAFSAVEEALTQP
ncbi:serine hydrolase domain-containing protein [Stenotrophomonas mori]|uniref:Beta-lactamase family protein n=1 Tax=Stenotrophomonas mori TaxID=2871096 RepID=A0ABT0SI26_9GAMM|nr:serine hydrolase [Stenotrophomonas mori]MCL7714978.1 beta-lactamase family protein [Stenotrophomonas mori]